MKVVALVSGGKDSCYAMMKCIQYGHQIVALANLLPSDDSVDELDSYMYQTVGHQIIVSYAECMGLPLFRRRIRGSTRHQDLSYKKTLGDEVEDMYILLKEVKKQIPSVDAVSSGAIASDYQRLRVESVCSRLGLVSLAYLWKQDQSLLLQEMIDNGISAVLVKVAAIGLDPKKHLAQEISSLFNYLHKLKELYGINVCGEGGEYETLTLDCPLFVHYRIILKEFKIILHSLDTIAPVGVLHPLSFHLENKGDSTSSSSCKKVDNLYPEKFDLVHEVTDDCLGDPEDIHQSFSDITDQNEPVAFDSIRVRKKIRDRTFSISCCLQNRDKVSSGLKADLKIALATIERELMGCGLDWKNVLYVHLYISDMKMFAAANEMYVTFITHEKCPLGVPSRSTVELPLIDEGLGGAYVEVLVTSDQSKKVLHVQSISSWAPSCIGPYSQATLHKNVLYMAGQLGLDPATMNLCSGGSIFEIEQALKNSEAVARCFGCSITTSSVFIIVYCSKSIPTSERKAVQERLEGVLMAMKSSDANEKSRSKVLNPVCLYIELPDLPKRALVEVKPVLYVMEDAEAMTEGSSQRESWGDWGFRPESWHDSIITKCIITGSICAAALCITDETVVRICPEHTVIGQRDRAYGKSLNEQTIEKVARFCTYLLDKILWESELCWDDIMSLRMYYPSSIGISFESLSGSFEDAFAAVPEFHQSSNLATELPYILVPVSGSGSSMAFGDVLTCELFAQRM
ncbi:hypothetical protein MLD38_020619 [Melastoma candidum]|uniref:Uncharacterized protein n=1 Tax=Melastoma candidum TaxID=119954 RepID=A0ACB9QD18_9MYRT|nr:hypothetical protein MLD38_020619 [Melastoma candidum]